MSSGVSIVIPTLNGGAIFKKCLEKIKQQEYAKNIQLIVIDSGSTDGTDVIARQFGATYRQISKDRFHHAKTRNDALHEVDNEYVVFMVQDAIPCTNRWLSKLEQAIAENGVGAVHIRQRPHDDADLFARFETDQHSLYMGDCYRKQTIPSREQFDSLPYAEAIRTIRLDNVCAIYRTDLLKEIPFPEIPFAEDLAWAYQVLVHGSAILYRPDIMVQHSHNRSADYRFKRAVVESVCCAKILGRTSHDMSFVDVRGLKDIHRKILIACERLSLKEAPGVRQTADLSKIATRLQRWLAVNPLQHSRKLKRLAGIILRNRHVNTMARQQIVGTICRQIRDNHNFVRRLYPDASPTERKWVDEQFMARQLGALYGTVYAGHMLKGSVDPTLEETIQPFFTGV